MRKRPTEKKILVLCAFTLLSGIAISWLLYASLAHRIIASIYYYRGEPTGILRNIMKERTTIPLESYYEEADTIMARATFYLVASFVLIAGLITRPIGLLLACSTFLFFSFLLFSLLEVFPSLIRPLRLDNIHYYAVKANWVTDDKLVVREKPLIQMEIHNFRGSDYSPLYGIDVAPTTIDWATDEHGFRNSHTSSYSDIVMIGDSFIEYGQNEADTFVSRLKDKLPPLTVTNLGKAGHGPFQYLEVLRRYGTKKTPKYAFFGFFEGNDISDIKEYLRWKESPNQDEVYSLLSKTFLQRYIPALRSTVNYIKKGAWIALQLTLNRMRRDEGYIHPKIVVLNVGNKEHKMLFVGGNINQSTEEILKRDEWQELKKILREFKDVCEEYDILPFILYIPTAAHIYAEYSTEQSGFHWLQNRNQQIAVKANTEKAMLSTARELNMELISLTPAFEAAAKRGKMLYYPFDSHWNSEGREVAAMFVADTLKSKYLVIPREGKQSE